jgi:putative membrane protein
MCYWSEYSGGWMAIGWVLMAVFWVGVIALAVWAFSRVTRPADKGNGALATARERYARGEISREEFDRIKKDLS